MRTLLTLLSAAIMLAMAHFPTCAESDGAFDYEFDAIEGGKLPLAQWLK